MDYRKRKYYLVTLDYFSYNMRINILKLAAPTLKIHSPYNHIRRKCKYKSNYDGEHYDVTGMGYVQFMVSCWIEESNLIEFELRKAEREDGQGSKFIELTKEMCGQ